MRAGWVGNTRLQDFVRRVDSGAELVAEINAVEGYDTKHTKSEWGAGSVSGGSVSPLDAGGVRLAASESTLAEHTSDDGTDNEDLSSFPPFDALVLEHLGTGAEDREFHTLTARLDPRADGGQPKTVDHFIAEAFRITKIEGADLIWVQLIARSAAVDASGEVAADFDFELQPVSGRFPVAGPPPEGDESSRRPKTLLRIIAYQADGTVADNVTWLGDSGEGSQKTDSSTYLVTHYDIIAESDAPESRQGGSVLELGGVVANMPRFSLTRTTYTAATISFDQAATDIDDISGSGDLRIVAHGEEWGDSTLTWEIWDGSQWVECVDGDVLGADNRITLEGTIYGSDLSGVSTTGPWDIRVTLTPSTSSLRSPVAIEFGIERVVTKSLAGAAIVQAGQQSIPDLTTLGTEIPTAQLVIPKTGERDYRDYGTEIVIDDHIGDIEVRVYVGDPNDGKPSQYLHRSEWMLHSVWDVEDYGADDENIVIDLLSPMRLLRKPIPPFVATSGNDGTRDAVTVSGTRKAAYEELLDSLVALPARYRGPGVEDTTHSVSKHIVDADAFEELGAVAFLGGEAVIESQGRIKAVKVMRDEPVDFVVTRFPLGTYEPRGRFSPGFKTRLDEFFVRFNFEASEDKFDNERRFVNATAFGKLGGAGLLTETKLDPQICQWIVSETLADLVGKRHPKHFGNGRIVWPIRANDGYRDPSLEIGDVVAIETDLFVARSPINDQPIRGPVTALAIVVLADPWGQDLDLWVPGFEYIVAGTGDVTREIAIEYTQVIPASTFGGDAGELHPSMSGVTEEYEAPVQGIPVGATITEFVSVMARANAADIAQSKLVNPTYLSPYGWTEIAGWDNTHSVDATDYTTESDAKDVLVTEAKPLTVRVQLRGDSDTDDSALAYVRLKYKLAVPA